MNHKHHYILFTTLGTLAIIALLYLTWAVFIDGQLVNKPLVVYDQSEGIQIQTEKLVYNPGDIVYGVIKYCKNRPIEAQFQWTLIDTYLKIFPKRHTNVVVGCHEVLTEIEKIPADQYPDDDLYFETAFVYRINAFNTVSVPVRSNPFRVR